jgi:hypothetical protein
MLHRRNMMTTQEFLSSLLSHESYYDEPCEGTGGERSRTAAPALLTVAGFVLSGFAAVFLIMADASTIADKQLIFIPTAISLHPDCCVGCVFAMSTPKY